MDAEDARGRHARGVQDALGDATIRKWNRENGGRVMELQDKSKLRPCIADGRRGLLHMFTCVAYTHPAGATVDSLPAGQEMHPCGVVEFDDGEVKSVPVFRLKMLDSAELFAEYCFTERGEA